MHSSIEEDVIPDGDISGTPCFQMHFSVQVNVATNLNVSRSVNIWSPEHYDRWVEFPRNTGLKTGKGPHSSKTFTEGCRLTEQHHKHWLQPCLQSCHESEFPVSKR